MTMADGFDYDDDDDYGVSEVDSDVDERSEDNRKKKKTKKKKKKKKKTKRNSWSVSPSSRNNEHDEDASDQLDEEEDIISVASNYETYLPSDNIDKEDERSDSSNMDGYERKTPRSPKKKKRDKVGSKTRAKTSKDKKKKKKKGKRVEDDESSHKILLEQSVKRVSNAGMENPAELFLISGDSGVGKSHWIETETNRILLKIREEKDDNSEDEEDEDSDDDRSNSPPVICRGKCEIPPQIQTDSDKKDQDVTESCYNNGCGISRPPMHAISEALNDLICSLTVRNYGSEGRTNTESSTNVNNIYGGRAVWKQRIEEALGITEAFHLASTGLVPELWNLLNISRSRAKLSPTWDWNSPYKFHRSCVAIRDLLRAISESHHPVIMVLHNLHQADKDTYRLLCFLLTGCHWEVDADERQEFDQFEGVKAITATAKLNNFLLIGLHEGDPTHQNDMLQFLERSLNRRQKFSFDENQEVLEQNERGHDEESPEQPRVQPSLTKIHMKPFHRNEIEDLLRSSILEIKTKKIEDKNEMIDFNGKIQELAGLIFEWTGGNVFRVFQVLEFLKEEGAITSSASCKLNIGKVQAQSRQWNNSIIGLTAARIDLLPKVARFVIINAAVFRQTYIEFSAHELFHLLSTAYAEKGKKKKGEMEFPLESASELEDALNLACDLGFMKRVRCRRNYKDSNQRWAFAHTMIRDEAYSLFAKKKRKKRMEIHFRLGTTASALAFVPTSGEHECGGLSNIDHDAFKFLAADQLAMAEEILHQDCNKVALLFVETAEICILKSAFCAAIRYLTVVIGIMERYGIRFAADNHGTCVKINLLLARLHSVCGNGANETDKTFLETLERGKNLKDQIMLHQAEIGISIGQKRNDYALKKVLSALDLLGEKFPPEGDLSKAVSHQIENLRQGTRQKDSQSLLQPSHCTDKKTFDLMILLSNLIEISRLCGNDAYEEVAIIRMMNICLISGFTPQYSMSFSHYAAILMERGLATNDLNMQKEGYRMGQISEKMSRVRSFHGGHSLSVFHHYISHWRRPYRRSLGQILSIYNAQLESGDYFHIQFTTHTYVQYHLASGHNLTKLDDNLQLFDALHQDYKMENDWMVELPQRLVANLLGETSDPFLFYGNTAEDQITRIHQMEEAGEKDAVQLMYFFILFVSFFFHNHELSKSCLEKIIKENVIPIWKPWIVFFQCYTDIVSLETCEKKSERKKLKERINRQRDQLLDWYDEGAINCSVMVSLIDAEYMMPDSGGKYSMPPSIRIKKFYDDAISVAEEQDLNHIEAFCFERASMRFEAAGSEELSAEYIEKAHESYLEWNAIAKVDDVEEKHASKLQLAKQAETKVIGESYIKHNSDMRYNPERTIGGGRNKIKLLKIKNVAKTAEKKVKEMAFGKSSGKSPRSVPKDVVKSPQTPLRRPKLAISIKLGKTGTS